MCVARVHEMLHDFHGMHRTLILSHPSERLFRCSILLNNSFKFKPIRNGTLDIVLSYSEYKFLQAI